MFTLYTGENNRPYPMTCVDPLVGQPIDLSPVGTTVALNWSQVDGTPQTRSCTILPPAVNGQVTYSFLSSDLVLQGMMTLQLVISLPTPETIACNPFFIYIQNSVGG
jgi:hypothetical protein